jgi:hypothetical protein
MTGTNRSGSLSLWLLVGWGLLCTAWNLYGAVQIANGRPALGPTATYTGAGLALALTVLFLVASGRWPLVYKALAAFAAVVAGITVWNAFAFDASNWNLQFWRWAGAALNMVGIVGAVLAIIGR